MNSQNSSLPNYFTFYSYLCSKAYLRLLYFYGGNTIY